MISNAPKIGWRNIFAPITSTVVISMMASNPMTPTTSPAELIFRLNVSNFFKAGIAFTHNGISSLTPMIYGMGEGKLTNILFLYGLNSGGPVTDVILRSLCFLVRYSAFSFKYLIQPRTSDSGKPLETILVT